MSDQEQANRKPVKPETSQERLPAPVYYIESTGDDTVLVGIGVRLATAGDRALVSWFDTNRERQMHGTILENNPSQFVFQRAAEAGGQTYSFIPLTLPIYQSAVKDKLWRGRNFDDEQTMISALLRSIRTAW